jgi:hypothetical protein|tara:strand:- start:447 stop:554 length:108 start_codon:yes stop_codon:yes gene_type:complete
MGEEYNVPASLRAKLMPTIVKLGVVGILAAKDIVA